jgi:hypothetical protein
MTRTGTIGFALATLAGAGSAQAAPVGFKPLVDARVRYENVDQEGIGREADAVTVRARAGFELSSGPWSVLAESEATLAIQEDYNSGLNARTVYPLVADPENIELNRLQLQYRGLPKSVVTVGRQRIALDDQRFVGNVGWRQNEQTFDAVRVDSSALGPIKLDASYVWSIRTIYGIDGTGARPQAISGDQVFLNAAVKTKPGTLTAFGYLIDEDEPLLTANSSQTYGVRFAGARAFTKTIKLAYAASYARQSDYKRNPRDFHADYYLADVSLNLGGPTLGGGYEVLGASGGAALTSFQTPLATLHKFQGWADKFLVTPPNGIRDLYASGGYALPKVGPFAGVTAQVVYHRFRSDRLGVRYGNEWDAQLSAKFGRTTALVKYADYQAEGFATDTRKLWLELDWVL